MKYQQFIYDSYNFDATRKKLELHYSYDNKLNFTETYQFDFDFVQYSPAALDRAIQNLFLLAGVSYYKAYLAPELVIQQGEFDNPTVQFVTKTYQKGLGEFFYVNNLDPRTAISLAANIQDTASSDAGQSQGLLVGLGGGKDSLVSVELLRDQPKIATWSLNHRDQLQPLTQVVGLPHLWVSRDWDKQLLDINKQDALNGHVPISAIFAAVGTIVAILAGYRDVVVSNESSASEPSLNYQGVDINHQYSKSLEFEQDYQAQLKHDFGDSIRYYSLLRPFSELRIAELFSQLGFQKYQSVFSSCNRAFRHDQHQLSWCGECAKCAFVFLIFTPFIKRQQLESLWNGKNLLLDPGLRPIYEQLLGITSDKPLDCVGEVKESRAAMRLAQAIYPELQFYQFDLPNDYDFRKQSEHLIPAEIVAAALAKLA